MTKFIIYWLATSFRFYFHDSVFLQFYKRNEGTSGPYRSVSHAGFLNWILSTLYYAVLHLSELKLLKFQICFNYFISLQKIWNQIYLYRLTYRGFSVWSSNKIEQIDKFDWILINIYYLIFRMISIKSLKIREILRSNRKTSLGKPH